MSKAWWAVDRRKNSQSWDEPLADVINPKGWYLNGTRIVIVKAIRRNGEILFIARWIGHRDDMLFYFDVDPQDTLIAETYYAQQKELK